MRFRRMRLHGDEVGRMRVRDARLALVRHAAGQETPPHGHDRACLHVVLRGVYVEHSATGTVVACPGDVVYKAPGVEHWNRFGTLAAESLRFELTEPRVERSVPGATGTLAALGSLGPDDFLEGRGTVRACVLDRDLARTGRAGAAGLERALGVARRLREPGTATRPAALTPPTALLLRLRRDFRDGIVIGEVARELGMHRSHLSRQFAREFGCSPQLYVAFKRAAWAAERLARGGETLAHVAAAAGFADQSHLARVFKRVFGTTPSRWSRGAGR